MKTDWSQYEVSPEEWDKYSAPKEDWSQYYVEEEQPMPPVERPQTKGWRGVAQDVTGSGAEFFRDLADILTNQNEGDWTQGRGIKAAEGFNEIMGGGVRMPFTDPGRVLQNLIQGGINAVQGAYNIGPKAHNYLLQKGILDRPEAPEWEPINIGELTGRGPQVPGDVLWTALTEYAAPGKLATAGTKGQGLLKGVQRALQPGAVFGAHEAGQGRNPVKGFLGASLPGMAEGVLSTAEGAGRATGRAIESLKPSSIIAKKTPNIPTEQLIRAMKAAEDTQTPLGDVLQSPGLKKKFENMIAPRLGSGADQIFTDIAEDINRRGTDIVSKMSTNPAGSDPNFVTKDLLTNAAKTSREIKNNLWNTASEIGAKENFQLELPSFSSFINERKKNIENSPLIRDNPKVQRMYNDVMRYRNHIDVQPASQNLSPILDTSGRPIVSEEISEKITYPTIREAKILANELGSEARRIFDNPKASILDKGKAELYSEMAKRLRNDVESQIQQKGSPELQNEYKKANDYHRDVFSDFLDKDIFPLTKESQSGQSIIRKIIKPSKVNDNFEAIQKVNNLLPENQQEIMGFSYLLDAFDKHGDINPNKMSSLIDSLGKRQFESLFKPETQKTLLDFQQLVRMNKEPIHRLFNPKTGSRNQDFFNTITTSLAALGGGGLGGIPGGIIAPALMMAVTNLLTKAATSQGFREKVVGKKIRQRAEEAKKKQERK